MLEVKTFAPPLCALTLNFLTCIVVSLGHLKSMFSRAKFSLSQKEKLLLMTLRSHQYENNNMSFS